MPQRMLSAAEMILRFYALIASITVIAVSVFHMLPCFMDMPPPAIAYV